MPGRLLYWRCSYLRFHATTLHCALQNDWHSSDGQSWSRLKKLRLAPEPPKQVERLCFNPTHAAASILFRHLQSFSHQGDAACAQRQGRRQQSPITICLFGAGGRGKGGRPLCPKLSQLDCWLQVGFVMPISMGVVPVLRSCLPYKLKRS